MLLNVCVMEEWCGKFLPSLGNMWRGPLWQTP